MPEPLSRSDPRSDHAREKACPMCGAEDVRSTEVDYTEFRCSGCGCVWNEARQILNAAHLAEFLRCHESSLDCGFETRFPMIPVKVLASRPNGVTVAIGRTPFTFEYPYSDYYIDEVTEDLWMEQVRRWREANGMPHRLP